MKKLVASVGLVALGASAVQTASAQSLAAPDNTKPWSVSAALRGFYDDNISTLPNNFTLPPGQHRDSFGFEVNPGVALAWSLETTTISLSYLYSLKYYNNKPFLSTSHDDQTHTFNAAVTHKFSEQTEGRVSDSFVVGQEPDMLRAGPTMATFQRIPGDNIRNYGTIGLDTKLTRLFGIGLGYDNTLYDYADKGETLPPRGTPGNILPSFAGTLNRMENGAHIEPTWQLWPETKGLLGYSFRQIDYTADEFIGGTVDAGGNIAPPPGSIKSDVRDNRSHRLYVGAEHNFTPDFSV